MDASVQAVAGVRLLDSYMTKRVGVPVDQLGRVVTLDKLKWLLSKPSHPYIEYLSQATGTLCKIYLDKDINCGKEKPSATDISRHTQEVVSRVSDIVDLLNHADAGERPPVTWRIATRHGFKPDGTYKLSFRPYISGVTINYYDIPYLLSSANQMDGYWDTSVYAEKENLLAAINGKKGRRHPGEPDDLRVLEMQDGDTVEDHFLDYVAQYVDPSWPVLHAPDGVKCKHVASSIIPAGNGKRMQVGEVLSLDPALCALLNGGDRRLQFRKEADDPEFHTVRLEFDKQKSGLTCPIAKRAHISNNGAARLNL